MYSVSSVTNLPARIGASHTPAFAVDIEKWWRTEGRKHYPEAEAGRATAPSS